MRSCRGASCAVVLSAVLWVTAPAQAVPFFFETFNYAPGAALKNQPGWAENGGANDTVVDVIAAGSLAYPGMTNAGNSLRTGGKFSFDSYVGANDNDPNSFIGGDGNTFWFGFLLKRTVAGNGGSTNPDYGGLLLGGNPNPVNNLFIGKPGAGATGNYVIEAGDGSNQHASTVAESIGNTAFLAVKITFHDAGMEDISLFANPSVLTPEGSLVASASGQLEMFAFNDFFISTGTNANWIFDDIRMGTTFADVAPEPASMATLISAATILLARRSRRKLG
jgi:hypothetical protein